MWLSKRRPTVKEPGTALTGPVTLPGEKLGAWLEGERRGVAVYAPGGYHWAPRLGEQVLVLKAGESGEQPCAVGVPVDANADLAPGEVLIHAGKSTIRLTPDGNVFLTGLFFVNGTVVGPEPKPESEQEKGES